MADLLQVNVHCGPCPLWSLLNAKPFYGDLSSLKKNRGRRTGEASEATALPEFRGFTTEKFLTS
jgi:hypothetical protein